MLHGRVRSNFADTSRNFTVVLAWHSAWQSYQDHTLEREICHSWGEEDVTHGEGKMLQFLCDVCQTLQVSFGGYFPSITLSSTMGLLML